MVKMMIAALMLTVPTVAPAQAQPQLPVPQAPAGLSPTQAQRNDIVCLSTFAASGARATDPRAQGGMMTLVGYYFGRLRTTLSAAELDAIIATILANGTLTRDLQNSLERCRAEALEVGTSMQVTGRVFTQAGRGQANPTGG